MSSSPVGSGWAFTVSMMAFPTAMVMMVSSVTKLTSEKISKSLLRWLLNSKRDPAMSPMMAPSMRTLPLQHRIFDFWPVCEWKRKMRIVAFALHGTYGCRDSISKVAKRSPISVISFEIVDQFSFESCGVFICASTPVNSEIRAVFMLPQVSAAPVTNVLSVSELKQLNNSSLQGCFGRFAIL